MQYNEIAEVYAGLEGTSNNPRPANKFPKVLFLTAKSSS